MAIILDGKKVAQQIKEEIAEAVDKIKKQGGKTPHLAAILVGDDGASQTYVNHKVLSCQQCGFESTLVKLPHHINEKELLKEVNILNNDKDIDGFIVQLPLPNHINAHTIIKNIHPAKDVDGFHPSNFGRMALGLPTYISATPFGILKLIERYQIDTQGKHCVVIGRSNIVGKPMSILMGLNSPTGNCTVTLAHSKTKNIETITALADILIVALGIPNYVTAPMVKQGATVIDVGITRVPDTSKKRGYRLVGDVHYEQVAPKCAYITPVPGGVGPMTVTALLYNTLLASKREVYT